MTQELGLRGLELVVNSIGDQACRPTYLEALKTYYEPHLADVCEDCRARHQRNPLRLLDCKQESCQRYIEQAPASVEHLCEACREHWQTLLSYLDKVNLPYRTDHRLVRGLDYYTRTVFEIQPPEEGSQNTIIGGGRYDGLIEQLGGRATPGIGFGSGIERFVMNLKRQEIEVPEESATPIVIVHMGDAGRIHGLELAARLRDADLRVLMAPAGRSLRAQLRYASSLEAQFSVVIGDDELTRGVSAVRNMADGTQQDVPDDGVVTYLREKFRQ